MTMTDPIADFLTRVRNAVQANKDRCDAPASRLKLELATLKRPARLESLARTQLGMAPPEASVVNSLASRSPAPGHAPEGRRVLADRRSPR